MIVIRKPKKSDKAQLLKLAVEFSKSTVLNRRIVPRQLFPLLQWRNYETELNKEVENYLNAGKKGGAAFVAEENGKLIGGIYGKVRNEPEKAVSRVGYVQYWFVTRKSRGNGIGKQLWNSLMVWFRKKKCKAIDVKVFPGNRRARAVYKKLGLIDKTITMGKKL